MKQIEMAAIAMSGNKQFMFTSALVLVAIAAAPVWSGGQKQADQAKPQAQPAQQGVTANKDVPGEGPDITVKQPQPTVTVDQPRPIVTVRQPRPEVIIKQPPPHIRVMMPEPEVIIKQPPPQVQLKMPKPDIAVQQAKPQVDVNRAPPDVQVQQTEPQVQLQPAQPQVQVEQTGKPKVTLEQAKPVISFGSPQDQAQAQGQQQAQQQQILGMTGNELVGQEVVGPRGEEIGEITDLVFNKQDRRVYAVVQTNALLGLGGEAVVLPVDQLQVKQNQVRTNKTDQELAQAPDYRPGQYQPIKLNIPIGEFAGL